MHARLDLLALQAGGNDIADADVHRSGLSVQFVVDGAEDHELLWFATQEIAGLVGSGD